MARFPFPRWGQWLQAGRTSSGREAAVAWRPGLTTDCVQGFPTTRRIVAGPVTTHSDTTPQRALRSIQTWTPKKSQSLALRLASLHAADRPREQAGQISDSHHSHKGTAGSRRSIQKAWTVLHSCRLAVLCSRRSCHSSARPPPDLVPLHFTACTAHGETGFHRPRLSPFISQNTQVTFPLKFFSYRNVKDGTFNETQWQRQRWGREVSTTLISKNVSDDEYFSLIPLVMCTA